LKIRSSIGAFPLKDSMMSLSWSILGVLVSFLVLGGKKQDRKSQRTEYSSSGKDLTETL